MTPLFFFLKDHSKIILLISLPIYGIIISSFNTTLLFILNPGAMSIGTIIHMPLFYNQSMYQYEWFTIPLIVVISNLLFWIPFAVFTNKYIKKILNRKKES